MSPKNIQISNQNDEQNNGLVRSIEILTEMTRENIERSRSYFDVNSKLELNEQFEK